MAEIPGSRTSGRDTPAPCPEWDAASCAKMRGLGNGQFCRCQCHASLLAKCAGVGREPEYARSTSSSAGPGLSEEDCSSLLRFVGEALSESRVEEIGDWDGGDIQQAMEDAGLLAPREVTEACNPESCRCAEYGFPTTCFRITPLGKKAIATFRAWQDSLRSSPDTPTTQE